MNNFTIAKIGIIGLGYIGLPLAVALGNKLPTIGFDVDSSRTSEIRSGKDRTKELTSNEIQRSRKLEITDEILDLSECNIFIITVPTPIDEHRRPDLDPIESASRAVAKLLSPGDIVIYESTVFPGATEEVCVPILEAGSELLYNIDFFCGYSPERANPGDKTHTLSSIVKITSGSTPEVADFVDYIYNMIVDVGTHKVSTIRVAEAAKIIENIQRDLNIALVNELAIIFNKLELDTIEILNAAETKWNFMPFRPGLVGGHCIGVDPYYLTYKAESVGLHPEIILAGRRINDEMSRYVAEDVAKLMKNKQINIADSRILILGLTFKENCPDLRNSRVIDLLNALEGFGATVEVYDSWVDPEQAERLYGINVLPDPRNGYDAILLAVPHNDIVAMGVDKIRSYGRDGAILYDLKSALPRDQIDGRL